MLGSENNGSGNKSVDAVLGRKKVYGGEDQLRVKVLIFSSTADSRKWRSHHCESPESQLETIIVGGRKSDPTAVGMTRGRCLFAGGGFNVSSHATLHSLVPRIIIAHTHAIPRTFLQDLPPASRRTHINCWFYAVVQSVQFISATVTATESKFLSAPQL